MNTSPLEHMADAALPVHRVPLCPRDGPYALPVLERFCLRARSCARVESAIAWHFEHIQTIEGELTRPFILHRERARVGAGYAHVLQEQAMTLLLGIVLGRPVAFRAEAAVFNRYGSLIGPDDSISAAVYRMRGAHTLAAATAPLSSRPSSRGWSNFLACRAARAKLVKSTVPPYRCRRIDGDEDSNERDEGSLGTGAVAGAPASTGEDDVVERYAERQANGSDQSGSSTSASTSASSNRSNSSSRSRSRSSSRRRSSRRGSEWVLALEDGNAYEALEILKNRWNRWTHIAKSGAPLADYFPPGPLMFQSPSVINMYAADFVGADGTLDATMRNERATVAELIAGHTDLSGPRCLVRRLSDTVHARVLAEVVEALRPTAATAASGAASASSAVLVGLHVRRGDAAMQSSECMLMASDCLPHQVRRGDAAMQSECVECVNGDDPDVVAKFERIGVEGLERELACVNRSVNQIEAALQLADTPGPARRVHVFVASDTEHGVARARAVLGAARVLTISGRAVHSTRDDGEAARKVAADFIGLALADVQFGIGDSSFLGNAAAAGLSDVMRVSDRVPSGNACRLLKPQEFRLLAEAMKPAAAADAARGDAPGHMRNEL